MSDEMPDEVMDYYERRRANKTSVHEALEKEREARRKAAEEEKERRANIPIPCGNGRLYRS